MEKMWMESEDPRKGLGCNCYCGCVCIWTNQVDTSNQLATDNCYQAYKSIL